MIAWNFQKIVGTCQFRVSWFGYPCGYSSLTFGVLVSSIRMYMSLYPMIGFHVRKGFCIGIQAAWKYRNKYICRYVAATGNVINMNGIANPVNFHSFTGFTFDSERCFL